MAGNKYGMDVENNACDAGMGTLLIGDGKGGFSFMENRKTGFWASGDVRDMVLLKGTSGQKIILARNNNTALVYHISR